MDKAAVERFSMESRRKLIKSINNVMVELGVSPESEVESIESAGDITIITLKGGFRKQITAEETKWRTELIEAINKEGYDNILEKVAYTWFNRLIAVRYLEVNDYIPSHVRVLSSVVEGRKEPDIITQCLNMDFPMTLNERELISKLKDSDDYDKLFSRLFIIQCRKLNEILPELFTKTKPYENLLLRISYVDPDGVVRDLVDNIPEDDFRDAVQIIGWMYQFYNSELKDKTFADLKKNVKITKETIPAATQLFTPDWIVRYMVENSVGRVWLEGHDDPSLRSKWRYFLDEAEQEPEVLSELKRIRSGRTDMMPSDIKVIDPCMGSGHILVYAFDLLMQIYESYGYLSSDAAEMIITQNLYGLDIDDRAYQLAYFAVMMKARQYDPGVFSKGLKPNLHGIPESNEISDDDLSKYGYKMQSTERSLALNDLRYIMQLFRDAKMYGSLLKPKDVDYSRLRKALNDYPITFDPNICDTIQEIVDVSEMLSGQYDSVVTNPPYMGSSGMDTKLSKFVKELYSNSKADLSTCFMEKTLSLCNHNGFMSMINIPVWMFLSSFETLRGIISLNSTFINMAHQGRGIFGSDFGSTAFVISKNHVDGYIATYVKLFDKQGSVDSIEEKESRFLSGENRFYVKQDRFNAIPGAPIAYWVSDQFIDNFKKGISINSISDFTGSQNITADNERFLRMWWEVDYCNIGIGRKWIRYAKGGDSRKYYGNIIHVVDWSDDARLFYKTNKTSNLLEHSYWYKEGITYTMLSSKGASFRYLPSDCIFDKGGPSIVNLGENLYYVLAFLNSNVSKTYLGTLNPTINLQVKDVNNLPLIIDSDRFNTISEMSIICKKISEDDWSENESSIEYISHPMLSFDVGKIEECLEKRLDIINERRVQMQNSESIINQEFNEIYGLDCCEEISTDLKSMDYVREIKDMISFAIGCMFGRYSLDYPGIQFAGGDFKPPEQRFMPDQDNIVPINDDDYSGDDVVTRFVEFIRIAFGEEHLDENLRYIANNLGVKGAGTSRERIRKYFLNDFYKDHLKMYSNLPIYWLFDSGKENGFKALVYMHRYEENLVAKIRQDYFLPTYRRYSEIFESEKDPVERSKLEKKINELSTYDLALELYSTEKVCIDLDDGVKVNYAKFQNINNPGGKGKINLLYKLK